MAGPYLIPFGFNFIKWLGEYVFNPIISLIVMILKPIITSFLNMTGSLINGMFSSVLYIVYTTLLSILDVTQSMFDQFSGVGMVTKSFGVKDVLGSYMTNYFVNLGVVKRAFWGVLLICLILSFVFTLAAVARASMDLSGKFAVGDVLRQSMKSFLTFFLLQVTVLTIMSLSNYTLTAVNQVMNVSMGASNGEDLRVANILFVCSAVDAPSDGKKDIFDESGKLYAYYHGPGSSSEKGLPFNQNDAKKDFDLKKIDYILGSISCIFMLYVMLSAIFFFVQRVFEVVFLYLVSPFFVASMPLDGGSRYKGWREMFVAKCIASYGVVITMKLFFIFLPVMMGGPNGVSLAGATDGEGELIRLLFILGAALAVKKAQSLILQIVNPQAAQQSEQAMGGFMGAAMAGVAMARGAAGIARGRGKGTPKAKK